MEQIDKTLAARGIKPDPPWTPQPRQLQALESEADEVLYGGARGGGKSSLIVGAAAFGPHRRSLLLRRTYPQLEETLITEARKWLPMRRGTYNEARHNYDDGERHIAFSSLPLEQDTAQYQGREYDLIAWDELPHFTLSQYLKVRACNRTTTTGQRCRILASGNPGEGEGVLWVRRYWAPWLRPDHPNPAKPGELRWFVRLGGKDVEVDGPEPMKDPASGEMIEPRSRTFIPASVADNQYLDQTYKANLMALPEPLRSAWLHGDWSACDLDDAFQVIPSEWITAAMARWTEDRPQTVLSAQGVDPARGGEDETVVARRYGDWVAPLRALPGIETPTGNHVASMVMEGTEGRARAVVDAVGIGAAVVDACRNANILVEPFQFAGGTDARDDSGRFSFGNLRAERWWRMRERLDPAKGSTVALPADPQLEEDLRSARWELRSNGIYIEAKDDIRERLGRSPDRGEAVCLAFWEPRTTFAAAVVDQSIADCRRSCPLGPAAVAMFWSRAEGGFAVVAVRGAKHRVHVVAEHRLGGNMTEQAAALRRVVPIARADGANKQRWRIERWIVGARTDREMREASAELSHHGVAMAGSYGDVAGVAALREIMDRGRLEIDPRCVRLINGIRDAQWAKTTTDERVEWFGDGRFVRAAMDAILVASKMDESRQPHEMTDAERHLRRLQPPKARVDPDLNATEGELRQLW
jgi:hypothetical protein